MKRVTLFVVCVFAFLGIATAQNLRVTGTVIAAEDGEPVIGASVAIKGTTTGTVTDYDGKFSLNVPGQNKTLVVTYVGMQPMEVQPKAVMKIVMQSSSQNLDEVIVVAYGTAKKSSFTGSAAVVSGKDLEKLQTSNITKSLEGTVAGIQTTSSSGQPGSSAQIFVRGIGSISSSQSPLYVVDGVPYEGSLNSIATSDIESMTVLKDAAANSLYGSRGSNGVILLTTKKGKQGKPRVSVDARWGSNKRANAPYDVLDNPATYYETLWSSLYNQKLYTPVAPGKPIPTPADAQAYAQANLLGFAAYNNYKVPDGQTLINPTTGKLNPNASLLYHDDWLKDSFTSGFRQEYNASVSGGTEKTNYYFSYARLDDRGYVPNSKFDRNTARIKVDQEISSWLNVGANLSYANTVTNSVLENSNAFSNVFMFAQNIAPIYPVYMYDQTTGQVILNKNGQPEYDYGMDGRPYGAYTNPLGTMRDDTRERKIDYVSGKAYANISLPYNFKVTSNLSYDLYNFNDLQFMTPLAGDAQDVNGRGSIETRRFNSLYWNQLINWEKKFQDLHTLKFLLGHESTLNNWFSMSGDKSNYFNPYNPQFGNAASIDGLGSSTQDYAQEGYFVQGNYDYANRYYLSGSFRRDGSSKFAPSSRWGNFYSLGASWRINEEEFLKSVTWVNNLKLKASYGTQGNDGLPNYSPFNDQYDVIPVNGKPGTDFTFRKADVTWEKSENFNAGIEYSLFDNRVSGNAEFFVKNTKDMLYAQPTPPSEGKPWTLWKNDMDMRNTGVEFDITVVPVKTKDLVWSVTLNGTHYKNKLTKLPSAKDPSGYQVGSYWRQQGGSLYDYYMVEFSRINPENGMPLFFKGDTRDKNGNRIETETPSSADAKKLGKSALPDFFGGIGTTLTWKGLDFSAQGAFSIGGYTYDSNYSTLMQMQSRSGQNWHKDIQNAWTPENKNTNVFRVQNGSQKMSSVTNTYYLISSSYFSLRNVTLGYTLPKNLVSKLKVGNIRLYVVADNVFLATKRDGMDPRTDISGTVGNTYAPIRTISGGVSLNF